MRLQTCKKVMGWCTAQWKMLLFCMKTIVKESRKLELARLKKKKKEKHLAVWRLSSSWCFLSATAWVCCSSWKHSKMNG